jgi:hypothetical protein
MMVFKRKSIVHIISTLIVLFFLCDRILIFLDKNPIFALFTNYYSDGGTEYKIGIGYSVILWQQLVENEERHGYNIGKEFVYFPMCYIKFYDNKIKPNVKLQFKDFSYTKEYSIIDSISMHISFTFFILIYILPIIFSLIIFLLLFFYTKYFYKKIWNKS